MGSLWHQVEIADKTPPGKSAAKAAMHDDEGHRRTVQGLAQDLGRSGPADDCSANICSCIPAASGLLARPIAHKSFQLFSVNSALPVERALESAVISEAEVWYAEVQTSLSNKWHAMHLLI